MDKKALNSETRRSAFTSGAGEYGPFRDHTLVRLDKLDGALGPNRTMKTKTECFCAPLGLRVPAFRKTCSSRNRAYSPVVQPHRKSARTCFEGPFAEVLRVTGPMAKINPFRFSTKYQDEETGLLYYGYRYLMDGRWLNRDPVDEIGFRFTKSAQRRSRDELSLPTKTDLNSMAMLGNDPFNKLDYLGLAPSEYHSHCCPELGYWTPCSQICKMALLNIEINRTIKSVGGGGVACYHGKACGCLVPDDDTGFYPGDCPAMDSVFQEHEDGHAINMKCKECGFYAAGPADLKPGIDFKDEECEKRKKSLSQLEGLRPSFKGKCASVADNIIILLKISVKDCP